MDRLPDVNAMNIAIIGAGITGLSTAIFLHHNRLRVTVYEKDSGLNEAGAGVQIPPNAARHFARVGLLERIKEHAFKPTAIEIRRYANSQLLQRLPGNPVVERLVGFPYLLIHRAHYQQILYEACVEAGVEVIFGADIQALDLDEPALILKDSKKVKCDMIIGADGTHSLVRKCMTRSELTSPVLSSHRAYRALIPSEIMRTSPYGKGLMASGVVTNWIGPSRHIVGYPISGSYFNLVMIHPGPVSDVESYVQQGSLEEMQSTYADYDESVQSILKLVTRVRAWKLSEMPELPRWSASSGKVVIIGDAAHAMLPYAAQGAAQGVEDAVVLATILKLANAPSKLEEAIEIFESLRKPRVSKVAAAARSGQLVWELPDGPQQEERDLKWKEAADNQRNRAAGGPLKESMFMKWIWVTDVQAEAEAYVAEMTHQV